MITSGGRLDGTADAERISPVALVRDWLRKCVTLRPGEPHVAAAAEGAGVITRLYVTLPTFHQSSLFRDVVLRIFWDGERDPSVEAPLGDFFGVHFCRYRTYTSRFLHAIAGGLVCTAPMPFERGFRVELEQQGAIPAPMVFHQIGFYELDHAPSAMRFHARWRREPLTRRGEPFTFVEATGRGHYVGVHLSTQNRELWLRPPIHRWMLPRGFGLGHLEGWEEIAVDDDDGSMHRGTGHEEYFDGGWYFRGGACTSLDRGCLERSYLTGRTATYRYHWDDPIPFRARIRGILHHGFGDVVPADYAATSYWYQEEPHAPAPALPRAHARRPLHPVLARVLE